MSCAEPPSNFEAIPPLADTDLPTQFWRFNPITEKQSCLYFGRKGKYRYDAPDQSYGVMYVGAALITAFCETVLHSSRHGSTIKRSGEFRLFPESLLMQYDVWSIEALVKPMCFADLVKGAENLQITAELFSMPDYGLPQRWSQWIHSHQKFAFDGLWTQARHNPAGFTVSIFDRAKHKIAKTTNHGLAFDFEPLWAEMEAKRLRPVP